MYVFQTTWKSRTSRKTPTDVPEDPILDVPDLLEDPLFGNPDVLDVPKSI